MERGRKVIDESVTEWLDVLRLTVELFDSFAKYATGRGAISMWGDPGYLTADFSNGWSASAGVVKLGKGDTYVKFASWCNGVRSSSTYESVKNDWQSAVGRAASGGAS